MFINQILTKLKSLVYSKSETDSLLNGKASSSHTHTKSQITDFPTIPSKTSQLTNDSGFLTSHQDLSGYVPKSGGAVMTGMSLGRVLDNSELQLCGASNHTNGASVILYGKDATGLNGMFRIRAAISGSEYFDLCGWYNGTLAWGTKHVAMQEDAISEKASRTTTGDWTITGLIPYRPVYLKVYVTSNRINNSTSVPAFLVLAVSNVCSLATMNNNVTFYISPDGFITTNKVIASFSSFVAPSETGTLSSMFLAFILPLSSSITIGLRNNNTNGNSISLDSAYCYQ